MRRLSLDAVALCVLAAILAAAPPAAATRSLTAPQRFPRPRGPWSPDQPAPAPPAPPSSPSLPPPLAPPPPPPAAGPECMWHEYHRGEAVSSWEFQLAPRRHMVRAARHQLCPRGRARGACPLCDQQGVRGSGPACIGLAPACSPRATDRLPAPVA